MAKTLQVVITTLTFLNSSPDKIHEPPPKFMYIVFGSPFFFLCYSFKIVFHSHLSPLPLLMSTNVLPYHSLWEPGNAPFLPLFCHVFSSFYSQFDSLSQVKLSNILSALSLSWFWFTSNSKPALRVYRAEKSRK